MKRIFLNLQRSFGRGISLIEVLVTMSILVILIKISFGSLFTLQIEERRQEAHSELLKLKSNIEQMALSGFVGATRVGTVLDVATELRNINQQITSPNGYYILSVATITANGYTLTAVAQGTQAAKDSSCATINLIVNAEADDTRTPPGCW